MAASAFLSSMPTLKLQSLTDFFATWYKYVLGGKWLYIPRDVLPLTTLQTLLPHLPLSSWVQKGMTTLDQLYSGTTLLAFTDLSSTFSLPRTAFFQYLQIWLVIQSISWPPKPCLSPLFSRYLLGSSGLRRGLSTIYPLLMLAHLDPNPLDISHWENELSAHFSHDTLCQSV